MNPRRQISLGTPARAGKPAPDDTSNRFVTGHDFSRAAAAQIGWGFSPCGIAPGRNHRRRRHRSGPLARLTACTGQLLRLRPPRLEPKSRFPPRSPRSGRRQTIGVDPEVVPHRHRNVDAILAAYEAYTGRSPTDPHRHHRLHYGPTSNPASARLGQWHNADAQGVGKDRSSPPAQATPVIPA